MLEHVNAVDDGGSSDVWVDVCVGNFRDKGGWSGWVKKKSPSFFLPVNMGVK